MESIRNWLVVFVGLHPHKAQKLLQRGALVWARWWSSGAPRALPAALITCAGFVLFPALACCPWESPWTGRAPTATSSSSRPRTADPTGWVSPELGSTAHLHLLSLLGLLDGSWPSLTEIWDSFSIGWCGWNLCVAAFDRGQRDFAAVLCYSSTAKGLCIHTCSSSVSSLCYSIAAPLLPLLPDVEAVLVICTLSSPFPQPTVQLSRKIWKNPTSISKITIFYQELSPSLPCLHWSVTPQPTPPTAAHSCV